MQIRYITQRLANEFVLANHRHHSKAQGSIFQLGLYFDGRLVAVAVCGRPVSRRYDAQEVLEVTRLCSDGFRNACSKLYAACARIAKEMGFQKIITYILDTETGASLKASGWILDGTVKGAEWRRNDGERVRTVTNLFGTVEKYPVQDKQRWVKVLRKEKEIFKNLSARCF